MIVSTRVLRFLLKHTISIILRTSTPLVTWIWLWSCVFVMDHLRTRCHDTQFCLSTMYLGIWTPLWSKSRSHWRRLTIPIEGEIHHIICANRLHLIALFALTRLWYLQSVMIYDLTSFGKGAACVGEDTAFPARKLHMSGNEAQKDIWSVCFYIGISRSGRKSNRSSLTLRLWLSKYEYKNEVFDGT